MGQEFCSKTKDINSRVRNVAESECVCVCACVKITETGHNIRIKNNLKEDGEKSSIPAFFFIDKLTCVLENIYIYIYIVSQCGNNKRQERDFLNLYSAAKTFNQVRNNFFVHS